MEKGDAMTSGELFAIIIWKKNRENVQMPLWKTGTLKYNASVCLLFHSSGPKKRKKGDRAMTSGVVFATSM